jgi:DNA invertase Pin-like site-specific DNA recombinase
MKRVAIYARVSTDKQQTSNQVLVLKEIAERSGSVLAPISIGHSF